MGYTKEVAERSFDLIPEGWYTAKVLSVAPKQVGAGVKLKWKWEIVEGEFQGRWLFGECWDNLDQSDGCVWRRWQETLLERKLKTSDRVDTDDVINAMAMVLVSHRPFTDKRTGEEKVVAEIPDTPTAVRGFDEELPLVGDQAHANDAPF